MSDIFLEIYYNSHESGTRNICLKKVVLSIVNVKILPPLHFRKFDTEGGGVVNEFRVWYESSRSLSVPPVSDA